MKPTWSKFIWMKPTWSNFTWMKHAWLVYLNEVYVHTHTVLTYNMFVCYKHRRWIGCLYAYPRIHAHIHTYIHTYKQTNMDTHCVQSGCCRLLLQIKRMYTYPYSHVHVHTRTHAYTHTYTHTACSRDLLQTLSLNWTKIAATGWKRRSNSGMCFHVYIWAYLLCVFMCMYGHT